MPPGDGRVRRDRDNDLRRALDAIEARLASRWLDKAAGPPPDVDVIAEIKRLFPTS
jgi:hypothetical protein